MQDVDFRGMFFFLKHGLDINRKRSKWLIHSGNLTWQWKIHHLKMYFLFKMGIFHCYVCLPEGNFLENPLRMHHEFPGLGVAFLNGGVALFHLAKPANPTKVLLRGLNGAENDRNCSACMFMFEEDISQYSMIFISRLMMYSLAQIQRLFLGKDIACTCFS